MRVLDLFSGIGGFSLGLERAGFRTAAFCEVLPKPCHLLATHWPGVPIYDDVRTLTGERLKADGIGIDAICGGFPCQDISLAGKGAGIDGERSGLWGEYARLVGELRPRLVFVENVSALLGRGLGRVLGDMAALGYHAWWDCIPASAVGAPHRRDRLWLVAYAGSLEHQGYGDALRRAVAAELSDAALAHAHPDLHACGLVGGTDCGSPSGGEGADAGEGQAPHRQRVRTEPGAGGEAAANAPRVQPGRPIERPKRKRVGPGGEPSREVPDAKLSGLEGRGLPGELDRQGQEPEQHPAGCGRAPWGWQSEPDVGRVAHGVPARVDRLHGLGNAVVPEIPYRLGKAALRALAETEGRLAA